MWRKFPSCAIKKMNWRKILRHFIHLYSFIRETTQKSKTPQLLLAPLRRRLRHIEPRE
jgi:hypothetical protein